MPRYRVQFSKDGPARFLSHLDLVRTFERAVRRAGLPVAFSQGFNPHPRFSFAAPLPVGVAGEQEYLDIELEQNISPKEIFFRLSGVSPAGLQIKEVRPLEDNSPSLMAALEKAGYEVEAELSEAVTNAALQKNIRSFLALEVVNAAKKKKGELKTRNIRPGIYRLRGKAEEKRVVLEMELQAGSAGYVRPEEVWQSFVEKYRLPVLPETIKVKRTELFFNEGK
ncbi:MAG: TIGR03936 family radical SAM-associated protein [Bacillota bacterium]